MSEQLDEILAERERWRVFDVREARWDGFVWGFITGTVLFALCMIVGLVIL